MNNSYTYDNYWLWADETWADRDAPIRPIVNFLSKQLFENVRPKSKTGLYIKRGDGSYNSKTKALSFDDVIAHWDGLGLEYHLAGMGMAAWLAMIPKTHKSDTPVLLVFHSADMSDPLWAMDTLAYFEKYNELAAANGLAVVYLIQDAPFGTGIFTDILLEVAALWRLDMSPIYLDLTELMRCGGLSAVPNVKMEQFSLPQDFYGICALDITGKWQSRVAHEYIVGNINRRNPQFDFERLKHSPLGKSMAEGMLWEYKYFSVTDPRLAQELESRGLCLHVREHEGERYVLILPKSAAAPLPLLICMKEVRPVSEFQSLTALQFYSHFIDIAAAGECGLLFFAMESAENNELLCGILDEVQAAFEIDRRRIYITGQSHNGYLAMEFARRHIDTIAAIATLNDRHGIGSPNYSVDPLPVDDAMLESYSHSELPLINICGQIENVFPHTRKGTREYANAIDAYHRRLRAFRCPDRTDEQIEAALESPDKATRENGLPADRTETGFSMGHEVYISDVKNMDGKWQLRFVTLENLPHMISPQMAELSWAFLRRFARESDGAVSEL